MKSLAGYVLILIIAAAAHGWGRKLIELSRLPEPEKEEALFYPALLGLGVMGLLLLLAGVLNVFRPLVLWGILGWGIVLFLPFKGRNVLQYVPTSNNDGKILKFVLLGISFVILWIMLLRLNVPAVTADELAYHLSLPKVFLLKKSIFFSPYHVNSVFPLLGDLLYSWGILLGNEIASKGVHFLFGILTALCLFSLSRVLLPETPAIWAPLLFLTVPGIHHQMALANNDLALTAFLTASTWALFKWNGHREKGWLIAAGIFSGFAMGVKYTALLNLPVQFLLIAWLCFSKKRIKVKGDSPQGTVPSLLLFGAVIFLVSLLWYLRSFLHTGNPLYPYLTSLLGGTGLENPLHLEGKGLGKDWKALLLLPWNMTFHPEAFGGMSNQWGPVFLGFLPAIFIARRKEAGRQPLLGICFLSTLIWFFSKQNLRFLLPALPFYCLIICSLLAGCFKRGKILRRSTQVFFGSCLLLYLGIALFQFREDFQAAFGLESREMYLKKKEPSYESAIFLNQSLGKKSKLLSQENRAYYFDGELVRERAYRRLTRYDQRYAGREGEFLGALRTDGFTHLLILKGKRGGDADDFLNKFIESSPEPVLVKRNSFGKDSEYFLYELFTARSQGS